RLADHATMLQAGGKFKVHVVIRKVIDALNVQSAIVMAGNGLDFLRAGRRSDLVTRNGLQFAIGRLGPNGRSVPNGGTEKPMHMFWRTAAAAAAVLTIATAAQAGDPDSCKTVRLSDIGWTDITSTTALTAQLLKGLGYSPKIDQL